MQNCLNPQSETIKAVFFSYFGIATQILNTLSNHGFFQEC